MDIETGKNLLQQFILVPLQSALSQLLSFVPSILGSLIILLVGSAIAKLLEQLIVQGLKLLSLDRIADQIRLSSMLAKGGIRLKLSELIGAIIYWIVILAFIMTALNALNLTVAAQLFQEIVAFLPNVVAAVFILVVGIFAAAFLATAIRTAASNSGIVQANLLSQAVQAVVIITAIVAALRQLNIQFVGEVFLIILSGLSLAFGLAFGLGCKDLAGRWVSDVVNELNNNKKQR